MSEAFSFLLLFCNFIGGQHFYLEAKKSNLSKIYNFFACIILIMLKEKERVSLITWIHTDTCLTHIEK